MTRLISGIKSTVFFLLLLLLLLLLFCLVLFCEEKIDNFRKFVTSGSIQTVIISLSDTCSPQGQLCGWVYSASETHVVITVIIVIITQRSAYYYRPIKSIFC